MKRHLIDYTDDILAINRFVYDEKIPIDNVVFQSLIKNLELCTLLNLLKEIDFPLDNLIKSFLEKLDIDYLLYIDSQYLTAVLYLLGYQSIDADDIPDNDGRWKVGFYDYTGKSWIDYSDEKEPFALLRKIYIEIINYHFAQLERLS